MIEFDKIHFHDGILSKVEIDWDLQEINFYISIFVEKNKNAVPHLLKFIGVSEIHIPLKNPWGKSVFIYSSKYEDGRYLIEMQSGDSIEIEADSFDLCSIL